ncbi:MAG TPA: type VI secretion system baseplate subunit TssF [Flavobacteriales bacterium]|nr:type VI secretion system baseplate subunit TssF [Flavobacteriales bacterium]
MEGFRQDVVQSKELIASRMFRNAARHWGYNDTELDNFDPVIKLLIEACSVEVFSVSNQISNVQERILERLASLLTPEIYSNPKPSHAILHARSQDKLTDISPITQFYFQKKIASKTGGTLDKNIDIFFSPAANYRLFNGDIKWIVGGDSIFSISQSQTKEVILKSPESMPASTVWLGIESEGLPENMNWLSMFFDIRNQPDKQSFFQLLPYSKISINGEFLTVKQGLADYNGEIITDRMANPMDEFKIIPNLERKISKLYSNQFLTVSFPKDSSVFDPSKRELYPAEFEDFIDPKDLKSFKNKVFWLKVEFTPHFNQNVLNEVFVSVNSFPVINRKLNEIRYRLQSYFNIVPLITDSSFLDVNSVLNISGKAYFPNPVEKRDLDKKGTYSVRSTGVERFDNRNAFELLMYLVELLKDESHAFAAYGQDFIANLIRELNENIALIEQKVKQNAASLNSNSAFLFIKPYEENENIYVDFWTTNAETANNIRSGTKLDLYTGLDLERNGVYLLTTSTGGSDKLRGTQLMNSYRNALLSRDRIISKQDIVNVCSQVWGKNFVSVDIQKGVMVSPIPHEGLVQTTEVIVKIKDKKLPIEEIESLSNELLMKLNDGSVVFTRYVVKSIF